MLRRQILRLTSVSVARADLVRESWTRDELFSRVDSNSVGVPFKDTLLK